MKAAVLLTCHNRKDKTMRCLESFYRERESSDVDFEVFLTDDGCDDGTAGSVSERFPDVHVVQGDGTLFWAGGMRAAWKEAVEHGEYDFFLWINDDTLVENGCLRKLFDEYGEAEKRFGRAGILVAACHDADGMFSYGGRDHSSRSVVPNGTIQDCKFINGNLVLVPNRVYGGIGMLDVHFTHGIADFSYGLTALEHGFGCWTTKEYLAVCDNNPTPKWCSPDTPLSQRFRLLYSPLGLNLDEYCFYLKKHGLANPFIARLKAFCKILSPNLYRKISNGK